MKKKIIERGVYVLKDDDELIITGKLLRQYRAILITTERRNNKLEVKTR